MLGRVVNDEALPKSLALLGPVGNDERLGAVRAQVVHDDMNLLCLWVLARDTAHRQAKRTALSVVRRMCHPTASERLDDAEDVRRALSHVLVVGARRVAGPHV